MELFIYCLTLLVLGAADPDPQAAISSSLAPVPKFGDRLKTPELTLYLTRDVLRALQDVNSPKKSVSSIETVEQNSHSNEEIYNQESQKFYAQQSNPKKSNKKNRGFVSRFFLPRDKDVIENQEKNDLAKFYVDSLKIQHDMYKHLQNSQQNNAYEESQIQANANPLPYIPVKYTSQEKILLQEQLRQQWNHILEQKQAQLQGLSATRDHNQAQLQGLSATRDHNQAQLQGLSAIRDHNQAQLQGLSAIRDHNQAQLQGLSAIRDHNHALLQGLSATRDHNQAQLQGLSATRDHNQAQLQGLSAIRDHNQAQLQGLSAIRDHNHALLQGLSASRHQNDHNNQIPPILIHSEVRITKHHPVPVYKLVDVPVPKSSFGTSS